MCKSRIYQPTIFTPLPSPSRGHACSSTPWHLSSLLVAFLFVSFSQMLARKHKIIVALITGSLLLLFFSSSPQIIDHVSMKVPYPPWADRVDSKGEEAFTPPDLSKSAAITETTLPGGAPAPGFTIFDRLYVWNGTIYAVTSDPRAFPQLRYILSQPKHRKEGNNLEPTSRVSSWLFVVSFMLNSQQQMQIVTPGEGIPFLGERAVVIEGMSFILYDTSQFMAVSSIPHSSL